MIQTYLREPSDWNAMMRYVLLAFVVGLISHEAAAQKSSQDIFKELDASNRAMQLEMEQSRLRMKQQQLETDLMLERMRADTEQLRLENETREAERKAHLLAIQHAEEIKKAEEAAEDLRTEIEQSNVRTHNNAYLLVVVLLTVGFSWFVVSQHKREQVMREAQKFGVLVIVGSALLMIFAITISEGWIVSRDVLQNLLTSLRIQLFAENSNCSYMWSLSGILCARHIMKPERSMYATQEEGGRPGGRGGAAADTVGLA